MIIICNDGSASLLSPGPSTSGQSRKRSICIKEGVVPNKKPRPKTRNEILEMLEKFNERSKKGKKWKRDSWH